jgi:hypothetical protein
MGSLSIQVTRGHVLLFVLCAILAGFFSYLFYRRRPSGITGHDWPLALLRGAGLSLLLFALFEPFASIVLDRRQRPLVAVLIDVSGSMSIEDVNPNRLRAAQRTVEETLLPSLRSRAQAVLFSFSGNLEMDPESLAPTGSVTDIGGAIRGVSKTLGREPSALVLVTDGISNVGERPIDAASDVGFPVYTVGVGDPSVKKDVLVKAVRANEIAYTGDMVSAEVDVESKGFGGEKTAVSVYEGGELIDSKEIILSGEKQEQTVVFEVSPKTPGLHTYRAVAEPLESEFFRENNARAFAMQVLKSKISVLLIGRPSWDASFLLRSCLADENVNLQELLLLGQSKYLSREEKREGPGRLPSNRTELSAYDAIVIHSPSPGQITEALGQMISDFVSSDGKGVLFLGSMSSLPQDLGPLVPVITSGQLKKQVKFEPTPAGLTHPTTSLALDIYQSESVWKGLPPVYVEERAVGLKAGASAMAVDPATKTAQGQMPTIAIQRFGRGKTMCILSDETWKWSFMPVGLGKPNDAHSRLFSNIFRWLVSRQEMERLRVKTERNVYTSGEEVTFLAQFYDENYRPDDRADIRLRVPTEEPVEIPLAPMGQGRYEGTVDALPPGKYTYRAVAYKGNEKVAEARGEVAVEEPTLEFMETRMMEDELAAVAEESGGRYFPLSQAGSLARDMALEPGVERRRFEFDLKTSPVLFAVVVLVFASEWVWRKRRGLP